MRQKLLRLLVLAIISMLAIYCTQEQIPLSSDLENCVLNERGKVFMQDLQTIPDWENVWEKCYDQGVPQPNYAVVGYTSEFGLHYQLPLAENDNRVAKMAILPLQLSDRQSALTYSLGDLVIIDKTSASEVPTFIRFNLLRNLMDDGFAVESYLVPEGYTYAGSRVQEEKEVRYIEVYFEGKNIEAPWSKNKDFLAKTLTFYAQLSQDWTFKHNIVIYSDHLLITILEYDQYDYRQDIDRFMNQLLNVWQNTLSEVMVLPEREYLPQCWEVPSGVYFDYPDGIYLHQDGVTSSVYALWKDGSTITPPKPPLELSADPCKNLSDQMKREEFTGMINDLKKYISDRREYAFSYSIENDRYNSSRHVGEVDSGQLNIILDRPMNGLIHTHSRENANSLPIFSADDVLNPAKWINAGNVKDGNTFSMGLISKAGTFFMFFDVQKYMEFANNVTLNVLSDMYVGYKITKNQSNSEAITYFVQMLQQLNSGITLCELGSDGKVYKLSYDRFSGKLKKEYCK